MQFVQYVRSNVENVEVECLEIIHMKLAFFFIGSVFFSHRQPVSSTGREPTFSGSTLGLRSSKNAGFINK